MHELRGRSQSVPLASVGGNTPLESYPDEEEV